jgi:transcription initiation factor TFIID TATA-box-binding protein
MAEIVNIVASTRYASKLDVNTIADLLEIDFEQEQFPGMVYRIADPKVCVLLFRSGKAVVTGAKNIESIDVAFKLLRNDLLKHEFELWSEDQCESVLHNIVVTCDICEDLDIEKINLSKLMMLLPFEKTEYEPEQFPGLIYRLSELGVVYLIFSSGKCVITGSNDFETAEKAEVEIKKQLSELKNYL